MACDYEAIRRQNVRRYGTDIGRIGRILLSERYGDRTHFILELLQNAEDALARRDNWRGSRSVSFQLSEADLRVSHFGLPFDEGDVRGICGIAETTKTLNEIGRFGIGFKSVYAFTDRPEIHSNAEHFAIESYVWPIAVPPLDQDAEETVVLIPLRLSDESGREEIAAGLAQLGASTLLFLRDIEEISWRVDGGRSGVYLRESEEVDTWVRRVTVIGQESGESEIDETWLVFSREVAEDGRAAGHAEVAFSLAGGDGASREGVHRVENSPLVVFFPTIVETHLGFVVQGPYRTTPSRDNVPQNDPWNKRLVDETASLLVEALRWLRDHGYLGAEALQCLPLEAARFGEANMFSPLFTATKSALLSKPLLPRMGGGHVAGANALLGRSEELRQLFAPTQLSALSQEERQLAWLSGDITQDRTPDLRRYLMQELEVEEMDPERVVGRLSRSFLEAQTDDWICRLYEFLNGRTIRSRLGDVPLVRLEDGRHVPSCTGGQAQAYLPGEFQTEFPTVRAAACASPQAREFLESLGLKEPSLIDDVVRNVLPAYREEEVAVGDPNYEEDLRRVLAAFSTDSTAERRELVEELRETPFVRAIDAGTGAALLARPCGLYLATERLKSLFSHVPGILMVDDSCQSLRGDGARAMLEACGAVGYLRPVEDESLSWTDLATLREKAGHAHSTGRTDSVTDRTLAGLAQLLTVLPELDAELRRGKAALLWEELAHLEERRGKDVFEARYTWTDYGSYRTDFPSEFVRKLNEVPWVTDETGRLQPPELVFFDSLVWPAHPFLESVIRFKPPVVETLAREAGIDPAAIDLLKSLGLTSVAQLRERLGLKDEPAAAAVPGPDAVEDALKSLLGETPAPEPPSSDQTDATPGGSAAAGQKSAGEPGPRHDRGGRQQEHARDAQRQGESPGDAGGVPRGRSPVSEGGRPFISYVGVRADEHAEDPDRLDQSARMLLEENAIGLILSKEPAWIRTSVHNPGYDLYQADEQGDQVRWCEVKAMTGSLRDRPIGLSREQFVTAEEYGDAYWLYIVEHAGTQEARIARIQDPAGKARTFTFDQGWLCVAVVNGGRED